MLIIIVYLWYVGGINIEDAVYLLLCTKNEFYSSFHQITNVLLVVNINVLICVNFMMLIM